MYARSAAIYDAVYSFKDYADEAAQVRALIHERNPGAHTLLDIACGTGKHLEHFSRHFAVEGLDFSPEQLAIARGRLPGVPLYEGDMADFALGKRFDAVTCLFSAIGSVGTIGRLDSALRAIAAHLEPGGVLIVEPWITPDDWRTGGVHAIFVDEPELKIARMNVSERVGDLAVMDMHYLVGTPGGVESYTERFELGLFTHNEYLSAFRAAGLEVSHDPDGLIGRGLYIGAPRSDEAAAPDSAPEVKRSSAGGRRRP